MCKRIQLFCVVVFLILVVCPLAQASSDCDFSYSNYARAVQLHDMGDYDAALRYYQCALEDDPDDAIIPILIANLHEDIDNSGKAWALDTAPTTVEILELPPVSTWDERARPGFEQDFEDLIVVESVDAEPSVALAEILEQAVNDWESRNNYALAFEQYRASFSVDLQSAQRHLTFKESGPYDLPQTQQSLSVHNYRHYATYRLSISYSRLEHGSVAIALPDEVYRDGNGVYGLPLVAGQAYRSSGYDMVVVLHVYQWANQVELLSGGGDMANGESILALDFGSGYELSFAEATWSTDAFKVESRMLGLPRFDPQIIELGPAEIPAEADAETAGLSDALLSITAGQSRHTLRLAYAAGQSRVGLVVKRGASINESAPVDVYDEVSPADKLIKQARIFVRNMDWTRARVRFEQALELDPNRSDIRCELGMVNQELGDERAALQQFDVVLAQDPVDACAWSNRDALMQRMRDG
jgi:tetratricopeptide (TPR) repeat protein